MVIANSWIYRVSLIVMLCFPTALVGGQSPVPPGWSVVMQAPIGEQFRVRLKDGREIRGRSSQVSPAELIIVQGKEQIRIPADNVRNMYRIVGRSKWRAALTIGGAGAVAGALLGAAITDDTHGGRSAAAASGAVSFGSLAALFGALGTSGKKEVLIFQSE
jgi:hypothetical protein